MDWDGERFWLGTEPYTITEFKEALLIGPTIDDIPEDQFKEL